MEKAKHVLLTGGTGFFGRALLRYWMEQFSIGINSSKITLLSRNPAAFVQQFPEFSDLPWLHFAKGDICDPETLPHGIAFTHILHAAADSTFGPQLSLLQRFEQIVQGTRNVLDLAVQCKAERFLLTSSGAVYGVQPPHLIGLPEDWHGMPDPLNPANAYGVAKRAAEHLCVLYEQKFGLKTVIARCFAFVGADLPLTVHFAIGNFIRDALWRNVITVDGDGSPLRSYLDQRDLAHWLTTLLHHGRSGEAYNVGSDQVISIANLAYLVRDTLAPSKPVEILGQLRLQGGRNLYTPCIRKATEIMGLRVCISLQDAIHDAAQVAARLRLIQ